MSRFTDIGRRLSAGFRRSPARASLPLAFETLESRRVLAAPTAVNDSYSVYPENAELLNVLANDSDPDSSFRIVSFTQGSLGGQVSLALDNGQQRLKYQAAVADGQTETFTYTISDGTGQSTATVSAFITPGDRFTFLSVPYIGVPGQLLSYAITSTESNPGVTYTASARWHDGVITQVYVANSSNPANSDARFSFWRTFTTYGVVSADMTVRGSDGSVRFQTGIGTSIHTVIIQPDPAQPSEVALIVGGLENFSDRILFEPATVNGAPAARLYYNGSNMGAFAVERLIVYGQGGDDLIQVNAAIAFDARLYGQAGNDTLVGGAGHDILIGSIGNDILYGFGGRDLVFGGLGQDFVQGAGWSGAVVGDDSDIVIGSYVSFDYDPGLLNQLSLRWRSPDPYATRINTIRSIFPWLRQNQTVFDDWSLDYVFGSSDLDWFFVEPTRDNFDRQANETLN